MFPLQVETILGSLIAQMDGAHFPVTPDKLPSQCIYIKENAMVFLREHGFITSRIAINHPGGGYGYRIENAGRSVVYLTDNELQPPIDRKVRDFNEFVQFCKDADVLIHDAQYVEQDMPLKHGWGHSLVSQAYDLAAAAGAKHLILFHHDPERTDDELDSIQEEALLISKKGKTRCTVGFEGLELDM
jgi:ribonuclease BN (tRNA processing enzyme)